MKGIISRLQKGEVMTNGNKQLSYCSNSFRYVVGDYKTLSIHLALKELLKGQKG